MLASIWSKRFPALSICIDGRMLGGATTGVGTYAETLLAALEDAGAQPLTLQAVPQLNRWRRVMNAMRPFARIARTQPGERTLVATSDIFREAQIYFDLYRRLMPVDLEGRPGLMHWTYPVPLYARGWRNIYTVHDAIPLLRPDLTPIDAVRHRRLLSRIARRADCLVTVSEAARRDILAATGWPPERVVACLQGISAGATTSAQLPDGLVENGYFLFIGSIEPRKNLVRLARAHAQSGTTLPLVLVGPDGWKADDVTIELSALSATLRLPYQDRATLHALTKGARALLFPSLSEGFGLPVAEAMTCGTPVLTSAGGALEEVAGDAAILVDPTDMQALTIAITRLSEDRQLLTHLRAASKRRAKMFALGAYADRLIDIYAPIATPSGTDKEKSLATHE